MGNRKKIDEYKPEQFEIIMSYKASVEGTRDKSQDDFEKYLHLLASGGLVVSLLALEKVLNATGHPLWKPLFVVGLFSLVVCLLSTLLSHKKSIRESEKVIDQINYNPDCIFDEDFNKSLLKGNKSIERFDRLSIGSLIFGIGMILTFFSINFITMNNEKPQPQKPQTTKQQPPAEEKGRKIAAPPKVPTPNKK